MTEVDNEYLISEDEFLPVISKSGQDFFRLPFLAFRQPPAEWVKRCYALLSEKAHDLETFLDEYNARNNRRYSYLRELFAALKWFGSCAFTQKHILIRFDKYALDLPEEVRSRFLDHSRSTLDYLNEILELLLHQLYDEANRLGMPLPEDAVEEEISGHDPYEKKVLPYNVGDERQSDPKNIIAEVVTLYKNLAGGLRKVNVVRGADIDSIRAQTVYELDETRTRQFESQLHNIQSRYDSYIKGTSMEANHPALAQVRGFTSIAFHLFELATMLVHFYERHLDDLRGERITERISALLPADRLLEVLNNYIRYYGIRFFLEGERHADRIIEDFIHIKSVEIIPPKDFSLHARPLSLVARIAMHYNTPLEIEIDGHACNAGSIMQMILLAGNNPRPKKITFRGEERALRDLEDLFRIRCLEKGKREEIPPSLGYLLADDPIKE